MTEHTEQPKWNWALQVENLCHSFGDNKVLYNINLRIKAGQIVGVIGGSGVGKSTLLRAILGTDLPKKGKILADGKPITGPSRNVGIVYQQYNLFDFMRVKENVAFGLKLDKTSLPFRFFRPFSWNKIKKQHFQQAEELLNKVGLDKCHKYFPSELSGGMRQRVALAQALIMNPAALLMDEPFGALDESTRESLQLMLINLYQENLKAKKSNIHPPHTILIVTHELDEALYVSDRIIGLSRNHSDGNNGATIVYDQPTPVFRPNDPKDFSRFAKQKEDIRRLVFSEERVKQSEKFLAVWNDSADTELPGIASENLNFSPDRI